MVNFQMAHIRKSRILKKKLKRESKILQFYVLTESQQKAYNNRKKEIELQINIWSFETMKTKHFAVRNGLPKKPAEVKGTKLSTVSILHEKAMVKMTNGKLETSPLKFK